VRVGCKVRLLLNCGVDVIGWILDGGRCVINKW